MTARSSSSSGRESVLPKTVYPFKIVFPDNKVRIYNCTSEVSREQWLKVLQLDKNGEQKLKVHDKYYLKNDLGRGKFGVVKLGLCKKTNRKVAIKCIRKRELSLQELELQRREITVLELCRHPHIIRLYEHFETVEHIYLVLEYLSGGDLFEYLDKREFKVTEDCARQISHQIATALYYLHGVGVMHRDIKLENIMMVNMAENSDVKLVDFGLSIMTGPTQTSSDPFGTLAYVAPEVLTQKPYGKAVDLWSLGVIIYVLLSGMLPFDAEHNKETARMTIEDPVPMNHTLWQFVSIDAKDLILRLLHKSQDQRLPLERVLCNLWICKRSPELKRARETALLSGDPKRKFIAFCSMKKGDLKTASESQPR